MTEQTDRPDLVEHLKATTGIGDQAEAVAAFLSDPEVASREPSEPLPLDVLRRHRDALHLSNEDLQRTDQERRHLRD